MWCMSGRRFVDNSWLCEGNEWNDERADIGPDIARGVMKRLFASAKMRQHINRTSKF
jgi:hypothetical protein